MDPLLETKLEYAEGKIGFGKSATARLYRDRIELFDKNNVTVKTIKLAEIDKTTYAPGILRLTVNGNLLTFKFMRLIFMMPVLLVALTLSTLFASVIIGRLVVGTLVGLVLGVPLYYLSGVSTNSKAWANQLEQLGVIVKRKKL